MCSLRLLAVGLLLTGISTGVNGEEKKEGNKEKLLGLWEVTKGDEGAMPVGSTMEVMKDGKVKFSYMGDSSTATYTVADDKLTITLGDRKTVLTIKKLSDTELALADGKGKSAELKRKKK
jgi:uncharacterized protein (TIGR03066 family)